MVIFMKYCLFYAINREALGSTDKNGDYVEK